MKGLGKSLAVTALAGMVFITGCSQDNQPAAQVEANTQSNEQTLSNVKPVLENYTALAHAVFEDSLTSAKTLQQKLQQLVDAPSETTLKEAREAWLAARVPYQQSEVFRFGNPIVDDWEGQLNAWPLDEGLIDYVDTASYSYELGNDGAKANIIASNSVQVGTEERDLTKLTPELLAGLNELAGSEANVATGYHAIEFLLWGQDLNGTDAGAGERKATDYAKDETCTNGNCVRRGEYLLNTAALLVQDLEFMEAQWRKGVAGNYQEEFLALPQEEALRRMMFGMGSLALGELAGERMKVALEANSPEDEHDCFSDNTHNSHFFNAKGIRNVFSGTYARISGEQFSGPSLKDLVAEKDADAAGNIQALFASSEKALQTIVDSANQGMTFDRMIAANNAEGNQQVQNAIAALVKETAGIEQMSRLLGINNLNPDTADHSF